MYDEYYEDILTGNILRDVCQRITGRTDYIVDFDNNGYNIGRLATLEYQDSISFISFSETDVTSRNSSFQSFPSALVRYHQEVNPNKGIYFYFLTADGNFETRYFIFLYRLMMTAGTVFLNAEEYLQNVITPFNSVSDIIAQRDLNRDRNRGNNSTYITIDEENILQIYGKTFGASKYETTLLCLAIYEISQYEMQLYEIREGGLRKLPAAAREVIIAHGITVITSDLTLEHKQFEEENSLRSPTFIYNLLEKLGSKKCALCECEIPQIIQGAHIWPVAGIKRAKNISQDQKIQLAIDRDNGIWLCNNHHKLFDINILYIAPDGRLKQKREIEINHEEYLRDITINRRLHTDILTPPFIDYLNKRNRNLNAREYSFII